jgi:hypothetical protein
LRARREDLDKMLLFWYSHSTIIASCRCSSEVEQLFCKQLVVGSIPSTGSLSARFSGGFLFFSMCHLPL